jgi:hypothetical protein
MTTLLTISRTMALPALLACWACAYAQSLGSPAATALIGQPLELSVPARFIAGEARDDCVHADVFYGDTRVAGHRVRATVFGSEEQRRVRVEADAAIDEPVVTVSVRAGCTSTITRNYTLLPDMPTEQVRASLGRAPGAATLGAAAIASPLRLASTTSTRLPSLRQAVARPDAPPRARAARMLHATDSVGTPRLKLEPFELAPQTMLRVSNVLGDPLGDAARRATAALLWQAINADPTEMLRTTAMIQQLEGDLASLRQAAGQTRAEMAVLRERLDGQRPWYASMVAVQILFLLVLAAAIAAGVLWYRTRRAGGSAGPWYAPVPDSQLDSTLDGNPGRVEPAAEAERVWQPAPVQRAEGAVREEPVRMPVIPPFPGATPPTIRTSTARTTPAAKPQPATQPQPPAAEAPALFLAEDGTALPAPVLDQVPPRRARGGVLRVETLAATFEEVEFLSSLGLTQDAMDILKTYLEDSASPAPVAFFELMRMCDREEDPAALAGVRRRYTQLFGLEPPRLEQVTAPLGVDALPELSSRLTAGWGRSVALDIIEQALFSVPAPGGALTLQAGRELICLYDLAMTLVTEAASTAGVDPEDHALAPWAHAEDATGASIAVQAAADADGGDHFALDVDLDAAPQALPEGGDPFAGMEPAPLEGAAAPGAAPAAKPEAQRLAEEDAFSAAVASERSLGRS